MDRKLHYSDDNETPVCGVYKVKREITDNIDLVTCRSCIRWEAYVRHDVSLFKRFYER